jgi:predicted metal-dependent hydrolase
MSQELIKRALELFPEKKEKRNMEIKYSKAFKGYNANCIHSPKKIQFRLSYLWKEVSNEIKIGLLQELFNKIYKQKKHSYNIDLYNNYIKKATTYSKIEKQDKTLKKIFDKVNEEYFNGMIDTPNLEWGQPSLTKLGSYDFMTNTISISKILMNAEEVLDYVMYHEMLHKKMQYTSSKKRRQYHTKQFREKEKEFKDKDIEKKLEKFIKKKKIKRLFSFK